MCRPEPIKVLVGQVCSVSTESFKVRVWRAGCWQNTNCTPAACGTAFLRGLFVSTDIFFLLLNHQHTFAL